MRLGWTVVPKELEFSCGASVGKDWGRIMGTLFNGAANVAQVCARSCPCPCPCLLALSSAISLLSICAVCLLSICHLHGECPHTCVLLLRAFAAAACCGGE